MKDSDEEKGWACFSQFLKGPPHCQEFQHAGLACECRFQPGCYQSNSPEGPQALSEGLGPVIGTSGT